jgi:membrane-bound lytic murein transglycosylase B
MQFLPSTWAEWGIDGFGPSGPPDIMNPLDAVPSAARLLCAAGAGKTATVSGAIFAYNHATWYVDEVLALASEYAQNDPSGELCELIYGRARQIRMKVWAAMTAAVRVSRP